MRLARMVAAGLVLGALGGFLGALLRPRSVHRYRPVPAGSPGPERPGPEPSPGPESGPEPEPGPEPIPAPGPVDRPARGVDVRDRVDLPAGRAAHR